MLRQIKEQPGKQCLRQIQSGPLQGAERAGGQAEYEQYDRKNADNDAKHAACNHFPAKADNARNKHQNTQDGGDAEVEIEREQILQTGGNQILEGRDDRGRAKC